MNKIRLNKSELDSREAKKIPVMEPTKKTLFPQNNWKNTVKTRKIELTKAFNFVIAAIRYNESSRYSWHRVIKASFEVNLYFVITVKPG